jgi:hypothetical protein
VTRGIDLSLRHVLEVVVRDSKDDAVPVPESARIRLVCARDGRPRLEIRWNDKARSPKSKRTT